MTDEARKRTLDGLRRILLLVWCMALSGAAMTAIGVFSTTLFAVLSLGPWVLLDRLLWPRKGP